MIIFKTGTFMAQKRGMSEPKLYEKNNNSNKITPACKLYA